MSRAALYLRSSKDRADVSIAAQRRELTTLAETRGLPVVAEYTDTVESAKDEHRPGFQALLRDLKSAERGWTHLLMVDTSRLSRRRYMAQVFKFEAKKRGVTILFARVPDMDPISAVLLDAVMEAFDEVHSLMSREKGLAGMRENVLQGFRAGGRAPLGYRLEAVETGALRDGEPVRKSRLALAENAPAVRDYLLARAAGLSRAIALARSGLRAPVTTLIGIERNALTYAGHTVWGVHAEFRRGEGYRGGAKFRPREDWTIQRDTHPALIPDAAAETVLAQLEHRRRTRDRVSGHALTGLLVAPDGTRWQGCGAHYRLRQDKQSPSRYVPAAGIEDAVLRQLARDLRGRAFAQALVRHARRATAHTGQAELADAKARELALAQRIGRVMAMAADLADPAPALREVDRLEVDRKTTVAEIAALERDRAAAVALAGINEVTVTELLADLSERLAATERERLRELLPQLIERITLDPQTLAAQIHYRIAAATGRDKVASPRQCEPSPTLRAISRIAGRG